MSIARRRLIVLFCSLVAAGSLGEVAEGASEASRLLEVSLLLSRETVQMGREIGVRVRFENHGSEGLTVRARPGYGSPGIQILAKHGRCTEVVSPIQFTVEAGDAIFDELRLAPGDTVERTYPTLNDLTPGGARLFLGSPGDLELVAVFNQPATTGATSTRPNWVGTVESRPVRIRVVPPEPGELNRRLQELKECPGTDVDCSSIRYFQVVQAPLARVELRRILLAGPNGPLASECATALAAQGTVEDAVFLEELSSARIQIESVRKHFRDLAREIRERCEG